MKAVILAGGGGTRLWPLSTEERPKQFQALTSEQTLIELTLDRLDFLDSKDIYLAINKRHLELTKKLCPKIPEENIIIEPALRDTSSCIGFSAAIIENRHPGETMAVIYADHLIQNKSEFQNALKAAKKLSEEENTLNIIEVEAKEPNTNYGYVKIGPTLKIIEGFEVLPLEHFTEKPDLETAKEFVKSGQYLWNTGIYVWKAKTLLEHYKTHQPDTYKKFEQLSEFLGSSKEKEVIDRIYPTLEKISIDYAIMEKVDPKEVRIIKADLDWSDIGSFEAIHQELTNDQDKNITRGDVKTLDCKGSLIYADSKKPVRVIGIDDIVVIDSPDGLLIAKKGKSNKIKKLNN